jgi:hypothetical protein
VIGEKGEERGRVWMYRGREPHAQITFFFFHPGEGEGEGEG